LWAISLFTHVAVSSKFLRRDDVKFVALTFLVISSLIADQAFAGDDSTQPLTRAECDRAAMAWDENANVWQSGSEAVTSNQPLTREECGKAGMKWSDDANVCGGANQAASEVTTPSQPLTRADCDKAGMTWKDNANVCSEPEASNVAAPPGSSTATNKPVLAIVINIDKTRQRMRVLLNGVEEYKWPVSTGRPSYFTPSGSYTGREFSTFSTS
jgi:L,D-transpeptidase-like protein